MNLPITCNQELPEFPSPWFVSLEQRARDKDISLFIGFPLNDRGPFYNAVAVIDRPGHIVDIRKKIDIIHGNYEGWASPGTPAPLSVDGHRIGYYICADAVNPNLTNAYVADNVEIMLSSAAWYPDPFMGPDACWENVARVSGVPLVIANTVGKTGTIDFTRAESRVYLHGKNMYTVPVSVPAVAFVDWNFRMGEIIPAGVTVAMNGVQTLRERPIFPACIGMRRAGSYADAPGNNTRGSSEMAGVSCMV
jgi:predicted amidohydrolase